MGLAGRAIAVLIGIAFLFAWSVGPTPRASAVQAGPSWSPGDYWLYEAEEGGTTVGMKQTVKEPTIVTVGNTTFNTWHVLMETSAFGGGISISFTTDMYWVVGDLATVKLNGSFPFVGDLTTTYDPPKSLAVFPLAVGNSWSKTTTETTISAFGTSVDTTTYTGRVTAEVNVTVPAGTFRAAVIRTPASGNPYTLSYYSQAAGNMVLLEEYDFVGNYESNQSLTEYVYRGSAGGALDPMVLVGGMLAIIVLVAVVALVFLRRGRPPVAAPPYAPSPTEMPPSEPPTSPEAPQGTSKGLPPAS